MIVQCTHCQSKFRFSEEKFGDKNAKKLKCPKCNGIFTVNKPVEAEAKPLHNPKVAKKQSAPKKPDTSLFDDDPLAAESSIFMEDDRVSNDFSFKTFDADSMFESPEQAMNEPPAAVQAPPAESEAFFSPVEERPPDEKTEKKPLQTSEKPAFGEAEKEEEIGKTTGGKPRVKALVEIEFFESGKKEDTLELDEETTNVKKDRIKGAFNFRINSLTGLKADGTKAKNKNNFSAPILLAMLFKFFLMMFMLGMLALGGAMVYYGEHFNLALLPSLASVIEGVQAGL